MDGIRYWTFLATVLCAMAASAERWYAKPGTTDWTDKSRYYNNDSKPESQKALPAPGDTLYLSGTNGKFYLDASGDKASLALVNTMSYVMPERAEAQLYVTVSGTDEVEFKPGITDRNNSGRLGGLVVKQGTGTLKLVNTVNSAGLSESYLMNFDIQAGVVKFPQGLSNASLRAANVKVAAGAKLYLMTIADNAESTSSSGTTYLNSLSGAGDVIYSYPGATTVRNLCIETDSTFDGVLTGPVVLTLNKPNARVNLTNPNSTFSGEGSGISIIGEGSHIGLESLCKDSDVSVPPTTPTAMGLNSLLRFYAKETGVIYLGNGGEMFYSGLNAQYSPVVFDAGATGGITLETGHEWTGYYGSSKVQSLMQHLILDGSNTQTVVFRPYLKIWTDYIAPVGARTNCTWYVTKRGTGTWFFDYNARQDWRGGFCLEDGKVQFNCLTEVGVNGPFGKATMLQVPYCGPWNPASNVTYAIAFGGSSATPVFEYTGSNIVNNTTRSIGLKTQGAIVNAGSRSYGTPRFCMKGVVSAGGDTEKTLVLDGTNEVMNTISDIADGNYGGTVGVTKRGSGNWTIAGPLNFSGKLKVEKGTLYVNDNRHYRWFKFTPTLTRYADASVGGNNYQTCFSEFALYDKSGKRVNVGMRGETYTDAEGDNSHPIGCGRDYTAIAPGRAAIGRYDYINDWVLLTFDRGDRRSSGVITVPMNAAKDALVNIFDGVAAVDGYHTFNFYNRTTVKNQSSWLSLFMHVTNTVSEVAAYDFAYFTPRLSTSPYSWKFEGSVNGLDWVLLDEKTQYTVPAEDDLTNNWNCWSRPNESTGRTEKQTVVSHKGWPVSEGPAATPTSDLSQATVEVAAGGVLVAEGEFTISKLDISATGAGRIEGFTFAENGQLTIRDLPKGTTGAFILPGTYAAVKGLENLSDWSATIDGRPAEPGRIVVVDGKISVLPKGFLMIVR